MSEGNPGLDTEGRSLRGGGEAGAVKPRRRRLRPLSLREAMYKRVLELYREGRRQAEIVRKIYEEFGERLSRGQVSEWCRGIHQPTGKVQYELKPSADLGWLLGALVGDGKKCFQYGSKGYYTIGLEGRVEIVEPFARAAAKVLGRSSLPIYPTKRGLVYAKFKSARLYYILSDFETLKEFVESNLEMVAKFLQGLWEHRGLC